MSTLKQGFGLMLQDKIDRKESAKSRGWHEFVGGVGGAGQIWRGWRGSKKRREWRGSEFWHG